MASITTRAGKGSPLTNTEVDANFTNLNSELATKQATLVSGTSIKTVNGTSVLGSGNIQIDGNVTSFNTRTGAITLGSGDVTDALGFTPYNATNPSGYITASGTAANVSGTVAIANGGTGATTRQDAIDALAGSVTSGQYLRGNGTDVVMSTIQVADVPTLNQNTTGTAAGLSATLAIASGGTGATTLAGANIPVVNAANTFTATQTFSGTSSAVAVVLNDAAEVATVSATAATGTIAYDITTQSVLYYTSNATANWTVNFRGSSGTSLNTLMSTGQSMTVAFLVTQGVTAYYNSAVQIDGTTSGVTTRWLGGAPTMGNASGIDSYRYLIIKTGSATFTVLASVTQFKA